MSAQNFHRLTSFVSPEQFKAEKAEKALPENAARIEALFKYLNLGDNTAFLGCLQACGKSTTTLGQTPDGQPLPLTFGKFPPAGEEDEKRQGRRRARLRAIKENQKLPALQADEKLQTAFKAYCNKLRALRDKIVEMNFTGFCRLLRDSAVFDNQLTVLDAEAAFFGGNAEDSTVEFVNYDGFKQCLRRLAVVKYPAAKLAGMPEDQEDSAAGPSAPQASAPEDPERSFQELMRRDILVGAAKTVDHLTLDALYSKRVLGVLRRYDKQLKDAFTWYSMLPERDPARVKWQCARDSNCKLGTQQVMVMLFNFKVMPGLMNKFDMSELLEELQQQGIGPAVTEAQAFPAFLEMLAQIAVHLVDCVEQRCTDASTSVDELRLCQQYVALLDDDASRERINGLLQQRLPNSGSSGKMLKRIATGPLPKGQVPDSDDDDDDDDDDWPMVGEDEDSKPRVQAHLAASAHAPPQKVSSPRRVTFIESSLFEGPAGLAGGAGALGNKRVSFIEGGGDSASVDSYTNNRIKQAIANMPENQRAVRLAAMEEKWSKKEEHDRQVGDAARERVLSEMRRRAESMVKKGNMQAEDLEKRMDVITRSEVQRQKFQAQRLENYKKDRRLAPTPPRGAQRPRTGEQSTRDIHSPVTMEQDHSTNVLGEDGQLAAAIVAGHELRHSDLNGSTTADTMGQLSQISKILSRLPPVGNGGAKALMPIEPERYGHGLPLVPPPNPAMRPGFGPLSAGTFVAPGGSTLMSSVLSTSALGPLNAFNPNGLSSSAISADNLPMHNGLSSSSVGGGGQLPPVGGARMGQRLNPLQAAA